MAVARYILIPLSTLLAYWNCESDMGWQFIG